MKFGHYAQGDDKAPVGSAIVAYAAMKDDPRAVPRYKERVPYVVRACHHPHALELVRIAVYTLGQPYTHLLRTGVRGRRRGARLPARA